MVTHYTIPHCPTHQSGSRDGVREGGVSGQKASSSFGKWGSCGER